jgi:hypothetical protein
LLQVQLKEQSKAKAHAVASLPAGNIPCVVLPPCLLLDRDIRLILSAFYSFSLSPLFKEVDIEDYFIQLD